MLVLTRVVARFRSFLSRNDGSVLPMLALLTLPLMGAVGAAIDYSRANSVKANLQASLDSALVAGAKDGSANWTQKALDMFNANVVPKGSVVAAPSFTQTSGGGYAATVHATLNTDFFGVFGVSSLQISVSSAVSGPSDGDESCLLTLDHGQPLSHVSLTFGGAPNIVMAGRAIRSNTSMNCNGHSGGANASIAAGTVNSCSNPYGNARIVPDIYTPLADKITTVCGSLRVGLTWTAGGVPVKPGLITVTTSNNYTEYHVCGDLTLTGSGYLTGSGLTSDSVIIVENGSITLDDKAAIKTDRTTIVLTGNNNFSSSINYPNGNGKSASMILEPSRDPANPWQGVAIYQDPKLTKNVDNTWGPSATFNADGVVYLPNSNTLMRGIAGSANYRCTKVVLNTLLTDGAVDFNFAQNKEGCTAIGMKQWTDIPIHLTQ